MKTLTSHLNILIVEDNPADLFLINEMLESSSLPFKNIYTSDRTFAALVLLKEQDIGLVILDLSLPDSFGIDSFLKIKEVTLKIPVIILTGLADSEVALETLKQGAQDYLIKGEFNGALLVKSAEYSIERKKAEEKILASEEKYRQMFYKNPFPALIYDSNDMEILEVNDAAIQKYGYEREEFLNLTIKDISPFEDIPITGDAGAYGGATEKIHGKLWQHKKKNGELMIAEVTFYQIDYFGKSAMQAQVNDVTEKIRLEKELRMQQKQKQRQITEAVLKAQEKERKGIGEELHDNINQILAGSRLYLDVALTQPDKRIELINLGMKNISMAIEEIRKLSKALIIPAFIKTGLKQSVEELVEHILLAKKINISVDTEELDETNLSEGLKITLYRIIQEQLNNILKYAEASKVTIRINTKADTILLSINDNGKGFDTHLVRKGVGITNINSRAGLFNGTVEIDSSNGNGCRLKVVMDTKAPVPQKAA
jgi:two-component system, NarL family, sensor histidine kinase UhpB